MRAVLLHPHPDMGGNKHNNVVSAFFDALPSAHRFDFASSDPQVAVGQTIDALGDGPSLLVGYSFGGGIASLVDDARVAGWVLVAPALSMVSPVIGADPRRKLVLAGERDQFFPPTSLVAATDGWAATEHQTVAGADHFFAGYEAAVVDQTLTWMRAAMA